MNYQNKICWVTGASSGIGEGICYELAKQGAQIVLSARNVDKLNAVAVKCIQFGATSANVIALDLSNENTIEQAYKHFLNLHKSIDLLVSNGGISQRSLAVETDFSVEKSIFDVNYFGTIFLTKKVLQLMTVQKYGQLAVTSSIAGKFGFPLRTTYSATKHALQGYFESLRIELIRYNIGVNIIMPGRIQTEISKHAVDGIGTSTLEMDQGLENGIPVNKAAKKIIVGLEKNKKEILVGGKELFLVYIRRFFPKLYYKIVSKISPK